MKLFYTVCSISNCEGVIQYYFNKKYPQIKQIPFWLILSLVYTIYQP